MTDDQTEKLIDKVNQHLGGDAYFYLSNDPERGLGLEGLIDNLHLVHIDQTQLLPYFKSNDINYFSLEEILGTVGSVYRSSIKLINHDEFRRYFAEHKGNDNYFQTFKISPAFSKSVSSLEGELLNTSAELNRMFENKLSQYEQIRDLDIKMPRTGILKLEDALYHALTGTYGSPFIVQFDRGHTGGGTFYIDSEPRFAELKEQFPKREVRVAEYISGRPYTLNACVSKKGIFMGGLSFQITGAPELTSDRGATVGNDFSYRDGITPEVLLKIQQFVKLIGEKMLSSGYLGLFGVDLIVHKDDVRIIEINARQPASIPMHTKIQLGQGQVPLALIHLLEFMGLEYDLDVEGYNEVAFAPSAYSQIFLRAKSESRLTSQVKMGIYRLLSDNSAIDRLSGEVVEGTIFLDEDRDKPLMFQSNGYTVSDLDENPGMLVMAPVKGRIVKKGRELARIQIGQQAVDNNGELAPWIPEALNAINNYQI
ncbi:MAG: ATP-grasp domain-containing protein [Candidatus Dojkabacteria bacterium]